jgi:hypothetical protein
MSENKQTVRARFYTDQQQDSAATALEGRPIFCPVEMVEVRTPGDRLTVGVFPVEDKHRDRWPESYAAFKRGEMHAQSGTPLEHWPVVTTSQVYEMKALSIFSVEDVASLSDGNIGKIGPMGRELREKAKAFIDLAKGGAVASVQAAEIAELKAMVQHLMTRTSSPAPAPASQPEERDIADLDDGELRDFIERETGEKPHHRTGRDKLIEQAAALAMQTEAA